MLQTPLHANDAASLARIEDILHDEMFDFNQLSFDPDAHVVVIPVRRQLHSGPERLIHDGWLVRTYEKDWIGGHLTLRKVRSWKAQKDQHFGVYSFCTFRYAKGILKIAACEALVLRFELDGIDLEYAETGVAGKAHVKRGPLGLLGLSNKVYQ